ncbi:winged helix-turn-helix transcriptional regulator [Nonomuraea sp. CA-143628]|uniref:winged helix-turn-helix transcriptional regulator n=1 Tax=Nonomuraea sp. CA-143628 TaxID=3239997 RepID=UPI003D90B7C9
MDQRSYNQFCATARTLDIVGERWTLLLVRELLTGPKRFGDLQHSLRGLGTGLLAARMKHLEREGLVRKIVLPAPARTPAYALTEAGEELGPAVLALARWGMKWAMGERKEGESFQAGWAVLALRVGFEPEAAVGLRAVYEFRVSDEVFHARVDDGTIETMHGPAQRPDVVIEMDDDVLVDMGAGQGTLGDAIKSGAARAFGDLEALGRLHGLFRFPQPEARTS